MANAYIKHMPISSSQEASIFSNEITWKILEFLRSAGNKGMTESEIKKEFKKTKKSVPSTSQIYSILKRLYENEWIHRDWDNDANARRHVISYHWGGIELDEEFNKMITKKMNSYFKEKMFPVLLECCKESLQLLSTDKKNKHWLPSVSNLCINCNESHESREFFDAILESMLIQFENSDEFEDLLKKNGYSE